MLWFMISGRFELGALCFMHDDHSPQGRAGDPQYFGCRQVGTPLAAPLEPAVETPRQAVDCISDLSNIPRQYFISYPRACTSSNSPTRYPANRIAPRVPPQRSHAPGFQLHHHCACLSYPLRSTPEYRDLGDKAFVLSALTLCEDGGQRYTEAGVAAVEFEVHQGTNCKRCSSWILCGG